ncbi:type II secretion system major pseudopilin GspG [Pseudoteredinibacter isoporae]|uniref:Type II secretion system core protein G n=1 Tax=Pseudoteredinibacter isoporae TaxID=570281 RepID=A0A7X0JT82_9GAMM|nr:type II secretion system major pseudopilin GspG [Pseudoteredinibacter isoporae]MBB6521005.1 general secretion pathway protein G [Pseudoteredinibacter isoporae]NHO86570.1 type II secretion system major pseudopilin GspG [Pseudoteredinibacter isoporae]NIB24978.1 type II secretion system major pseudopilin GspG [Pseudoteredinibacter isoporae]
MKSNKAQGMTLIELLVVLAILAMIAGLVGPTILEKLDGAKHKTAGIQIKDLESGLEIYKLEVGRFPSTEEGLQALMNKPGDAKGWNGPYLKGKDVPQDPWSRDFIYKYPGANGGMEIISYGADGQPGGEGDNADISN